MSDESNSLLNQLQRNSVAIISLVVALSSLGYTTWRNEKTEDNRNQRFAAFEILKNLNQLQQVVFHLRYDQDQTDKGNPRTGWTHALTIKDFSLILPAPLPNEATQLVKVWDDHWESLVLKQPSVDAVLLAVDDMRDETLELLRSLE